MAQESEVHPNFWGHTPEEEYYTSQGVRNTKSHFETPNGKIFTQSFFPLNLEPHEVKATVFMTHGYGSDTGWLFQKICINFSTWGYAVFAADLLGHGRSDGLRCYLGDMDKIAATSLSFFLHVRNSEPYKNLPAFLLGESMGGLATLLMYFKSEPNTWTGLMFSAPLFVIPDDMKPSRDNFSKVTAPFFTAHGTSDGVTCPSSSRLLYEKGSSEDKSLKLYDGMYHSLIQGEPDESANLVLGDMREWIDERVRRYGPNKNPQSNN
ncbi:hypothetical protein JHK82_046702 [Glycine max]|nr:hypothetical protein JHK85_047154 [Glycine max]KAG5096848.1 hypothetical protein JHK82_046702 [Glycine max]